MTDRSPQVARSDPESFWDDGGSDGIFGPDPDGGSDESGSEDEDDEAFESEE